MYIYHMGNDTKNTCGKQTCRSKYASNALVGKSGGYREGAGRTKSGWFSNIWCVSLYELAFVIYNIDHNNTIVRNRDYFEYVDHNDKIRKYYPDFRVNGRLVEIKGVQREYDQIKLNSVTEPIDYFRGKEGNKLFLNYACSTYNVSYRELVTLYDLTRYMFTKTCGWCNKEYDSSNNKSKFFSRSCAGKHVTTLRMDHLR